MNRFHPSPIPSGIPDSAQNTIFQEKGLPLSYIGLGVPPIPSRLSVLMSCPPWCVILVVREFTSWRTHEHQCCYCGFEMTSQLLPLTLNERTSHRSSDPAPPRANLLLGTYVDQNFATCLGPPPSNPLTTPPAQTPCQAPCPVPVHHQSPERELQELKWIQD